MQRSYFRMTFKCCVLSIHSSLEITVYSLEIYTYSVISFFLFAGDEAAPGNLGFKDQLLALQWIKQNIEGYRNQSISCHIRLPSRRKRFSLVMVYYWPLSWRCGFFFIFPLVALAQILPGHSGEFVFNLYLIMLSEFPNSRTERFSFLSF